MGKFNINKAFTKLIKFLFFIFLLLCCYIILSSKFVGTTSNIGGFQLISVLTASMYPEIKPGSLILVKKINDPETLKVNDVITFQSPRDKKNLITHRILEVKIKGTEIYFITKGDANITADAGELAADNVFAKYQNITIPYGGYILQLAKTKIGLIVFFIIPVFFLFISKIGNLCFPFINRKTMSFGGGSNENQSMD